MTKPHHKIRPNIKLAKLKTKQAVLGLITVAAAALVIAGTFASAAGTTPQVYLAPSSGSYNVGDDVAIAIRENGNGSPIGAAQVGLTYNPAYLQYNSIDATGSAFSNDVSPSTQPSGEVVITRFTTGTASAADQLIATVHFKALVASTANLAFSSLCANSSNPAADCTGLSSGGNSVGISTASGSYSIKNPSNPTCPSGYTGTYPNCVAPSGGGGSGSSGSTSSGSTTTTNKSTSTSVTPSKSTTPITAPDNSQVQVSTPVDVQPATIQPDGLQKVQYYLNGKLVYTANAMPYTYHIDTKHLLNGTYTLKTVEYFTSGRTNTSTTKLLVKNPFSFIQFGLFLRHYIVEILIPFALIILAIVLLYYRVNRFKMPKGPGSSTIDKPGAPRHDLNVQGPTIVAPGA